MYCTCYFLHTNSASAAFLAYLSICGLPIRWYCILQSPYMLTPWDILWVAPLALSPPIPRIGQTFSLGQGGRFLDRGSLRPNILDRGSINNWTGIGDGIWVRTGGGTHRLSQGDEHVYTYLYVWPQNQKPTKVRLWCPLLGFSNRSFVIKAKILYFFATVISLYKIIFLGTFWDK